MKIIRFFTLSILVVYSSTASAAITLYQGGGSHADTVTEARSAFIAATSATIENFDPPFPSGTSIDFPTGGPTEFTASSTTPLSHINAGISGNSLLSFGETAGHSIAFSFASPISAFGIDILDVSDRGNILSFTLNTGDSGAATTLAGSWHDEFFGVISTTPFSSITFTWSRGGDGVYWDDLRYQHELTAAPESIPMMSIWGLGILSGLIGLLVFRRKETL